MSDDAARLQFEALGKALERLREALAEPLANRLAVDGTLQRFESIPTLDGTYRELEERFATP